MSPFPPCESYNDTYSENQAWPELLGVPEKVACAVIEKSNSNIRAVAIPSSYYRTLDFCVNRVWVEVDKFGGVVVEIPRIG